MSSTNRLDTTIELALAWLVLVSASVGAVEAANCTPPPPSFTLPGIKVVPQQSSLWCWAATAQLTKEFVVKGASYPQCKQVSQIVNAITGSVDCCKTPTPDECLKSGWPQYRAPFTATCLMNSSFGGSFQQGCIGSPSPILTWGDIRKELSCNNRPIAFAWRNNDKLSGHVMAIIGYYDNTKQLLIHDSADGGSISLISYAQYVGGTQYPNTHWRDYYEIIYPAPAK